MSKRRIAPLTFLRRLLLRILAALAVFWGGGIALFSVVPVPFSAVMAERQISAGSAESSVMWRILTGSVWRISRRGWGWR